MTTIVLDKDLIMASDSQASHEGHRIQHPVQKVFSLGGYTIGVAGRYSEAMAFVDSFEDMIERQRVAEDTFIEIPQAVFDEMDNFNAIVVDPANNVFMFEGSRFSMPVEAPISVGSGADYAYGALAVGASAEESVRAALLYDVYSGGDVQVVDHKAQLEAISPLTREQLEGCQSVEEVVTLIYGEKEASGASEDAQIG